MASLHLGKIQIQILSQNPSSGIYSHRGKPTKFENFNIIFKPKMVP